MADPIVGKTIVKVRPMTKKEVEKEGWDHGATALVLSDGTVLYASQDQEGNGPGAIFGTRAGKSFGLY